MPNQDFFQPVSQNTTKILTQCFQAIVSHVVDLSYQQVVISRKVPNTNNLQAKECTHQGRSQNKGWLTEGNPRQKSGLLLRSYKHVFLVCNTTKWVEVLSTAEFNNGMMIFAATQCEHRFTGGKRANILGRQRLQIAIGK